MIITHRGLDPSRKSYFAESSREAFADQLSRGFGIEFDPQITADGDIVVLHDPNLARISNGTDTRMVHEVEAGELLAMEFDGCHLSTLDDLLTLVAQTASTDALSALHVKHSLQNKDDLDRLLLHLEHAPAEKLLLFDVTMETAAYLRRQRPDLQLAPSVAHPYDRERFNRFVGGTLVSIEDALAQSALFSYVWLDEWDRKDEDGTEKKLYTEDTFKRFREHGLKIAVISPELHATSPGLLGNESHEDARNAAVLEQRQVEIMSLLPDAICTDYPDRIRELSKTIV